ncbi:hypothetical protein TruAng_011565 [Truncatella angustata]|nr:hypothetical protein TruAng_011565 [Truncatella angustata]
MFALKQNHGRYPFASKTKLSHGLQPLSPMPSSQTNPESNLISASAKSYKAPKTRSSRRHRDYPKVEGGWNEADDTDDTDSKVVSESSLHQHQELPLGDSSPSNATESYVTHEIPGTGTFRGTQVEEHKDIEILETLHELRNVLLTSPPSKRFPDEDFWTVCNDKITQKLKQPEFENWSHLKKWVHRATNKQRARIHAPRLMGGSKKQALIHDWVICWAYWELLVHAAKYRDSVVEVFGRGKLLQMLRKKFSVAESETSFMPFIINERLWEGMLRREARLHQPYRKTRHISQCSEESDLADYADEDIERSDNDGNPPADDIDAIPSIEVLQAASSDDGDTYHSNGNISSSMMERKAGPEVQYTPRTLLHTLKTFEEEGKRRGTFRKLEEHRPLDGDSPSANSDTEHALTDAGTNPGLTTPANTLTTSQDGSGKRTLQALNRTMSLPPLSAAATLHPEAFAEIIGCSASTDLAFTKSDDRPARTGKSSQFNDAYVREFGRPGREATAPEIRLENRDFARRQATRKRSSFLPVHVEQLQASVVSHRTPLVRTDNVGGALHKTFVNSELPVEINLGARGQENNNHSRPIVVTTRVSGLPKPPALYSGARKNVQAPFRNDHVNHSGVSQALADDDKDDDKNIGSTMPSHEAYTMTHAQGRPGPIVRQPLHQFPSTTFKNTSSLALGQPPTRNYADRASVDKSAPKEASASFSKTTVITTFDNTRGAKVTTEQTATNDRDQQGRIVAPISDNMPKKRKRSKRRSQAKTQAVEQPSDAKSNELLKILQYPKEKSVICKSSALAKQNKVSFSPVMISDIQHDVLARPILTTRRGDDDDDQQRRDQKRKRNESGSEQLTQDPDDADNPRKTKKAKSADKKQRPKTTEQPMSEAHAQHSQGAGVPVSRMYPAGEEDFANRQCTIKSKHHKKAKRKVNKSGQDSTITHDLSRPDPLQPLPTAPDPGRLHNSEQHGIEQLVHRRKMTCTQSSPLGRSIRNRTGEGNTESLLQVIPPQQERPKSHTSNRADQYLDQLNTSSNQKQVVSFDALKYRDSRPFHKVTNPRSSINKPVQHVDHHGSWSPQERPNTTHWQSSPCVRQQHKRMYAQGLPQKSNRSGSWGSGRRIPNTATSKASSSLFVSPDTAQRMMSTMSSSKQPYRSRKKKTQYHGTQNHEQKTSQSAHVRSATVETDMLSNSAPTPDPRHVFGKVTKMERNMERLEERLGGRFEERLEQRLGSIARNIVTQYLTSMVN